MKKTFPLESSKHKPARVIEAIVADVRRYLKRERRKKLPEGVDFWDFDCRVGPDVDAAEVVHVSAVSDAIHKAPENDWTAVYVEILAKPGHRTKKETPVVTEQASDDVPSEDDADDSTGLDG